MSNNSFIQELDTKQFTYVLKNYYGLKPSSNDTTYLYNYHPNYYINDEDTTFSHELHRRIKQEPMVYQNEALLHKQSIFTTYDCSLTIEKCVYADSDATFIENTNNPPHPPAKCRGTGNILRPGQVLFFSRRCSISALRKPIFEYFYYLSLSLLHCQVDEPFGNSINYYSLLLPDINAALKLVPVI